jgi:hypothetical protein
VSKNIDALPSLLQLVARFDDAPSDTSGEVPPPQEWAPTYAHPWPDSLPGRGARRAGPYSPCQICGHGSWMQFGEDVLCLQCARSTAGFIQ